MSTSSAKVSSDVIASLTSGSQFELGGDTYFVQNGDRSWSLSSPDSETLRFEVRSGDRWDNDADWKERSEVSSDSLIPFGETVSISYQFMVEPGDDNQATGALGTGNWLTLGQFHSDDGGSSSTFAVELIGEKIAIRAAYKLPGEDYTSWYAFKDTADIVRGKYYDMKIEARFVNDGTGFLNVWRDGVQIVDYDGPMGYGAGVYWKYGIYRHEQDETLAVNYRHMAVGDGKDGGGVVIVGTPAGDEINAATSPEGQPTVTDDGDTIVGGGGADVTVAGSGDDTIIGSKGNDVLTGGAGNDLIKGGAGNDKIFGIGGKNKLAGGLGKDTLVVDTGSDLLTGGKGKDSFVFADDYADSRIKDFRPGEDTITFAQTLFADFAALKSAMSARKGGVLIDTGDSSVFLDKVKIQKLDADDFLFV